MEARLYVIPGSHPSMMVRLILERKGIPYKRVDLMPVISKAALKAMRFPTHTIPALRLDGRKIQGSGEIARELDRMKPEPPLYPSDPDLRTQVEQAEHWGEEDLQRLARRLLWNAIRRDRRSLASFAEGARLGIPIGLAVRTAAPIIATEVRMHGANDEQARADLAALPGALARIEDWIEAGVLRAEEPNAADYQIATSLRLILSLEDAHDAIAGRPAGELATRVVPDFPGHVGKVFPAAWLEPLREAAPAPAG